MTPTFFARKRTRNTVIAIVTLLLSLTLSGCGGEKLTLDEAAVEPCATFDKMTKSMSAFDRSGVMMNAAEASKQFEDIASLDPRFDQFAQFLKGVSVSGSTGDPMGTYSDMLFYCIPINSTD
ncbi:MAG: hypothetical protein NTW43_05115 [Actinobacteria bacterium]|nr:hypothetical protein [Actinomycetota bacterium]